MFDQNNRGAELIVGVEHKTTHVLLFFHVHARHRFVEEQHRWLGCQGAGEFHAFFDAVGQARHGCFANGLQLQKIDDLFDFFAILNFLTTSTTKPERLLDEGRFNL